MKSDNNQSDAGYMLIQFGWQNKFCFPYDAGEAYLRSLANAEEVKKDDSGTWVLTNKREEIKIDFMTTEEYNIMKAFEIIKPGDDDDA